MPRLVIVAFGTRGDVQPLVLLAHLLRQRCEVTFVTHAPFRSAFNFDGLTFVGTPTDAVRPPVTGSASEIADEYEAVVRAVEESSGPVSYTHLTLPTILLV